MANPADPILRPSKAPNLLIAPTSYAQQYQDQLNNALRLYFNQVDNDWTSTLSGTGGKYFAFPYGAFQDDTTQYDGSTTIPYAVRLNTTDYSNGVSIEARTVLSTASIGPASTTMTVTAIAEGRFYPGMILSGTGVTAGTYVYLQTSSTATAVATPTGSGGGAGLFTFTVSSAVGIETRQFVSGTGIVANTRVVSIVGTTVTVDTALTGAVSGTVTFRPWGYQGTYLVNPSQTVASTLITGTTNSKITVEQSGIYNVQFSFQFTNPDNAIHDIDIWFKKNDVTIPKSNSQFSINARKSSGNPSHLITALNYYVDLLAADYLEIVWHTSNSAVYMESIPEQTAPLRPATPSAIVTVSFVSRLPA